MLLFFLLKVLANLLKLTFILSSRIGIRSEDLEDFLEKTIKGCGIALSSPRLVIPAAIYGLWILSHQKFAGDLFDFQVNLEVVLVPSDSFLKEFFYINTNSYRSSAHRYLLIKTESSKKN